MLYFLIEHRNLTSISIRHDNPSDDEILEIDY